MKEILSIIIRANMQPRYWSDHLNMSNDLECDGRKEGQGKRFYDLSSSQPTCIHLFWFDSEYPYTIRGEFTHVAAGSFPHLSLPSEVVAKMILMGHPVSSCHVPVFRSCFILFHTLTSSWKFCYVHLSLHVITPYIVCFSHLYISTKCLEMSHFWTVLSQKTHF